MTATAVQSLKTLQIANELNFDKRFEFKFSETKGEITKPLL